MNIFMITSVPLVPPWDQGDKNLAYTLARALPRHRFRILTTRDERIRPAGANLDPESVYGDRRPSLVQKARVYRLLLSPTTVPLASMLSHRNPPKQAARRAVDLYHLIYQPYPLSSWLNRLLPEFRRRPTLHTLPSTAEGQPLSRHLFFADRLVAISEHGRQTMRQLGLKNVLHIPPGIQVARWQALAEQTEQLKTRLELAGHPVVLFPGHYGPGQGTEVMLRALPGIAARVPGLRVIFACRLRSSTDQERERGFHQALDSLGLTENIRFCNTATDMQTLIGASDLIVLPLETMRDKLDIPTTLLESLAAGKPIVISDLPPMNELVMRADSHSPVQDNVGLTVPTGDADALAEAIVALLTDHALRERMGQYGQALVRDRFDINQVAQQYEKLYEEMV